MQSESRGACKRSLAPLTSEDLAQLITDALHPNRSATALGELIHEKTAGNPFSPFSLFPLVEEGLLPSIMTMVDGPI
jgi:hypothetical protein